MKKILIYGDSNVWGDNFLTGVRIKDEKQWVNILKGKLGNDYILLQEGLPGRIAGNEEEEKVFKNGKDSFISTFRTNSPVDVVIISLGTNDLQIKYNKNSDDIISDLLWYKETISNCFDDLDDRKKYFVDEKMPRRIYILPFSFDYKENASVIFTEEKELERQKIIKYFNDNNIENIYFNDISLFDDGIHLNYDGHQRVADKVFEVLKNE